MSEFLSPGKHFEALLARCDHELQQEYNSFNHIRQETCYRGRTFIIYDMHARQPRILGNVRVMDFLVDDANGASVELRHDETGRQLIADYTPRRLFDWPVYIHLPLHLKLRWSTTADKLALGSLAFDMAIRTKTRASLRERGAVYCETGVSYAKEFQGFAG